MVTEWNEFRALDLNTLKGACAATFLSISHLSAGEARAAGFNYTSVGQADNHPSVSRGTCCPKPSRSEPLAMPYENRITVNVALQLQQLQHCSASRSIGVMRFGSAETAI